MSLVRLLLQDQATKETIGTVSGIELDTQYLEEVRKKINTDSSLSLGDYSFVVFGTPLERKQEKNILPVNASVLPTSQILIFVI